MKNELIELIDWFRANKLSLNISKTNYVMLSPKNLKLNDDSNLNDCNLVFGNESIEESNNVKFLGLQIDKHLEWNKQFDKAFAKLSRGIYFLNRVKNFLPHSAMVTLYHSLFHCHLMYGLVLWGTSITADLKEKLRVKQKKAIRALNNAGYNAHTHQLFVKDKILKIDELIHHEQLKVMYQVYTNDLPEPLLQIFSPNPTQYRTRQLKDPKVLKPKYDPLTKSFFAKGPTLWSNVTNSDKLSKNLKAFAKTIKKKLIENNY